MKQKFINQYSNSNKNNQINLVIDWTKVNDNSPIYNSLKGTVSYGTNNSNYLYMRAFDYKTKSHINTYAIKKYNSITTFDIKNLPITTSHTIKQKVIGDIQYLMKCGESYIFSSYNKKSDPITLATFKKDLKFKFLIDKHCKNGGCIEFIVNNDKFYMTNIFTSDKIVRQDDLIIIGNKYDINTLPVLSSKLLQYDIDLMDSVYNDYKFNDNDYTPNKEYLIMFEFRNSKYLMCKLIIEKIKLVRNV